MPKNRRELFLLIQSTLVVCIVFLVVATVARLLNPRLSSYVIDTVAGGWTGIAAALILCSLHNLDRHWGHSKQENFRNRVVFTLMTLTILVFLIAGSLNSGVVFDMDFSGACPSSPLESMLGELIRGSTVYIIVLGAFFAIYLGTSGIGWFAESNYTRSWSGKGLLVFWGLPAIFFSYQFSRVFSSPFILTAVISSAVTAFFIIQVIKFSERDMETPFEDIPIWGHKINFLSSIYSKADLGQLRFHVFTIGLFLIPLAATFLASMPPCTGQ